MVTCLQNIRAASLEFKPSWSRILSASGTHIGGDPSRDHPRRATFWRGSGDHVESAQPLHHGTLLLCSEFTHLIPEVVLTLRIPMHVVTIGQVVGDRSVHFPPGSKRDRAAG